MTYDTKGLSMNCHNIPKFASYFWTVLNDKELIEIDFFCHSIVVSSVQSNCYFSFSFKA